MNSAVPKPKTTRSKAYLAFIREQRCLICGNPDVDAHHTETGGVGMKGSDLSCLPLCRAHHIELHDKGRDTWKRLHGIDYVEEQNRYLKDFIRERL